MTKHIVGTIALFLAVGCSSFQSRKASNYYSAPRMDAPALTRYIQNVLGPLRKNAGIGEGIPLSILDTPEVNACISYLDGIFISGGMLNVVSNEAQLAGLLAHELGHKKLHRQARIEQDQKANTLWEIDKYVGKLLPKGQVVDAVHSKVREAILATFTQQEEADADAFGVNLMAKTGYDPTQFVLLFDNLEKLQAHSLRIFVDKLRGTHPFLGKRASNLRAIIAAEKLKGSRIQALPYRNAVNAMLAGRLSKNPERIAALETIQKINSELRTLNNNRSRLSTKRFIEIMESLRTIQKQFHLGTTNISKVDGYDRFMEEVIEQDSPLWDENVDPLLSEKFSEVLVAIGRAGVGAIPGMGDAIDLYEVLTGIDFFTSEELDTQSRVASAIGLIIGSGSQWRGVLNAVDKEVAKDGVRVGEAAIEAIEQAKRPQLWTRGKPNDPIRNALTHYKEHRKEFPEYANAVQYVEGAYDFVKNPPFGTLIRTRANDGAIVFYHEATNTMAVQGPDGVVRTMYRPDPKVHKLPTNRAHFDAQK